MEQLAKIIIVLSRTNEILDCLHSRMDILTTGRPYAYVSACWQLVAAKELKNCKARDCLFFWRRDKRTLCQSLLRCFSNKLQSTNQTMVLSVTHFCRCWLMNSNYCHTIYRYRCMSFYNLYVITVIVISVTNYHYVWINLQKEITRKSKTILINVHAQGKPSSTRGLSF